ncbi:16S rRNA (guanine(966)-N(2))-methyltransferase RsmD [Georgenia faecalis]|uniref:16S rRNA (Guanine(966)-N(2))-methyltransferase RsmD n=1 Tax=Georgenia faecalis TaxID=2483799 RepID=A0ABV9DA27_9MICO|nr:16S rRNA (guanine(966)-N(2))-methyltransferase RsmD [Georgenia faecalis]
MTRIVAGTAGGRALRVPRTGTRPTSERVREALFSRLEHAGAVDGARVLDLFAGSGALGLEAASRGARSVVLVEVARAAAELCRRNAREVGLAAVTEVVPAKVATYLAGEPGEPFDLVLLDPPYDLAPEEVAAALDRLAQGWLAPGATVVLEAARRAPATTWPEPLEDDGERRYGDTTLRFASVPLDAGAPTVKDMPVPPGGPR